MSMQRVCVFCGSAAGNKLEYLAAARELGATLANRGLELVYGGASIGLMGALADGALAAGGRVIGVMPESLVSREIAHCGLTELHVVATMHERKATMADLSDAFIALPGGFGTLDEFCEILTWAQLGMHRKPCGLLNIAGFYDFFLTFLDQATDQGFVKPSHRSLLLEESDPDVLLDRLASYRPQPMPDKVAR